LKIATGGQVEGSNMKVTAAPGTQCPKEGKPREYITDSVPVEVPDSAYYRRLVSDGSLVPVVETPKKKEVKADGQ
jgi:hypothetical protein